MNRRHVDPPLDVSGDDDARVVVANDVMLHDAIDPPVDDVVIDLRGPRMGRVQPPVAVRQILLPVAIDVSTLLDGVAPYEARRLVVELTSSLINDDNVDVQLLDGRSGQLRPLTPTQQASVLARQPLEATGTRQRLEKRLSERLTRAGLRSRRWEPEPDTWFIDIEPAWLGSLPRSTILPELQAAGVRVAAFVPDLDPLHNPQWFSDEAVTSFRQWLRAHRTAASTWLAASLASADDLVNWLGPRSKNHDVKLLPLGVGDDVRYCPIDRRGGDGRLLMVGSISPRNGHRLMLDALNLLAVRSRGNTSRRGSEPIIDPIIDVVGTPVEGQEQLMADLERHRSIRLHQHCSDAELELLWQEASFLLVPGMGDGVGLAIAEAMARSIPVAATNRSALAEASQGLASAVKPTPHRWADFLDERVVRHQSAAERAIRFASSSWSEAANELARHLHTVDRRSPSTISSATR